MGQKCFVLKMNCIFCLSQGWRQIAEDVWGWVVVSGVMSES